MNFQTFRRNYRQNPFLDSASLIRESGENAQVLRNQISRWTKKKLLLKLKKGTYIFSDLDRKAPLSLVYLANNLCIPSYVSLEWALSFYELIPEMTQVITSITSLKTRRIKNSVGLFSYQHIKRSAFGGFVSKPLDGETAFFIAEPEKALVDFCYLNLSRFQNDPAKAALGSYRFQNFDQLNHQKLSNYAQLFECKKLDRVIKALAAFIGKV